MKLFLGIDGGQSSTVALIADESGRILGTGRGGPCNHVASAEARVKFRRAMAECLNGACAQSGLDADTVVFEAACLGFSGGMRDKEVHSREFFLSRAFKITHDAEIALTGATRGVPGIIVIAGTGSIAFGKNAEGRTARAGGWGYIFGDQGGGFDLVRQALGAALALEEGWGAKTVLRSQLLAATRAESANTLMHGWYNNFNRSEIAKLAALVDQAAEGGDAIAIEILQDAGRKLAALALHVHTILFPARNAVPVSYIGGVFESRILKDALRASIHDSLACEISAPLLPPAAGALMEAFHLLNINVELSQIPEIKS